MRNIGLDDQPVADWPYESATSGPIDINDRAILDRIAQAHGSGEVIISRMWGAANRVYQLAGAGMPEGLMVKLPDDQGESHGSREAATLGFLALHNPPLQMPRLVAYEPDTQALVTTEIYGYSETNNGLERMRPHLNSIGLRLGQYMGWLASIDPAELGRCLEPLGGRNGNLSANNWDIPLETMARYNNDDDFPALTGLVRTLHAQLKESYPPDSPPDNLHITIDDVKPEHLIINRNELIGIVDLESITRGPIERSMRRFCRPGLERLLDGCIKGYQQATGNVVDRELVRLWHGAEQAIAICYQLNSKISNMDRYIFRCAQVMTAFPDTDFSELCRAIPRWWMPHEGDWLDDDYKCISDAAKSLGETARPIKRLSPRAMIPIVLRPECTHEPIS